jgi:hypothetical protein
MPVEMLWSAREYDRQPGGEDASRDEQSYAQLREDVRVNGIKDPVILDWDPETGKAYLSEGNHRVGIARELGLLDVPCRAVVGSRRSIERRPRTIQLTAAGMFDDDLPGYGGIYDPAALLVAQRVAA